MLERGKGRLRDRRASTVATGAKPEARAIAWEILQRVETGGYADALLAGALASADLEPVDRGLASRLVYGTLAWQGYLDHILRAFTKPALDKIDPPIRILLRLALFQICKLDRIPRFAAVDTAVTLSKRHKGGAAAGFVNAVLRRAAREWSGVSLRDDDPKNELALRWSHPRWLVDLWTRELGESEVEPLLRANNEEAPTTLRVCPLRTRREEVQHELAVAGIESAPCRFSPLGLDLKQAVRVDALPGYREGRFSPQGEASQIVGLLVGARPGMRVLDACAAPGGKSAHLAEQMNNQGEVTALDIHATGVATIRANALRLGMTIVRAAEADATTWSHAQAEFDAVLVDAPCSGLGTLRQHPEIRWRRSPADLEQLAEKQARLLRNLAPLVRPGGALIYSTCTLARIENETRIEALLAEQPELRVDDPVPYLPEAAHALVGTDGFLRLLPSRHGLDGFFAARLRRRH